MKSEMPDYWDYLIHFTDEEGFLKIFADEEITASPAGYYYKKFPKKTQAVCLTETPLEFADRF